MDVELDRSGFQREFVATHRVKDLEGLAGCETVNIDEGSPAARKGGTEVGLGGEGTFQEGEGVREGGEEGLRSGGCGVAGEDGEVIWGRGTGGRGWGEETADDGKALGACTADDEDVFLGGAHDEVARWECLRLLCCVGL